MNANENMMEDSTDEMSVAYITSRIHAAHIPRNVRDRVDERISMDQRYRNARKNGVRTPLTRADLAAQCLRRQQMDA